jgi:hypothetical protein
MIIDKILIKFFDWIDKKFEKLDEVLTFKFPKNKKKKKPSNEDLFNGE